MEVGFLGTWELQLPTPNPGSKNTPKAFPTHNSATSPARHTQPQPKNPSHWTEFSGEIRTTIPLLIVIKGEEGGKKTLKLSNTEQDAQTLHTVKLQAHVNAHA